MGQTNHKKIFLNCKGCSEIKRCKNDSNPFDCRNCDHPNGCTKSRHCTDCMACNHFKNWQLFQDTTRQVGAIILEQTKNKRKKGKDISASMEKKSKNTYTQYCKGMQLTINKLNKLSAEVGFPVEMCFLSNLPKGRDWANKISCETVAENIKYLTSQKKQYLPLLNVNERTIRRWKETDSISNVSFARLFHIATIFEIDIHALLFKKLNPSKKQTS